MKKRRVGSYAEAADALEDAIYALGVNLIDRSGDCEKVETDLVDIVGVSDTVNELYKKAIGHLKQSPDQHLDKVEVKTGKNIYRDDGVLSKKMEDIVCDWAEYILREGDAPSCRVLIEILRESAESSCKVHELREKQIATYMKLSEELGERAI